MAGRRLTARGESLVILAYRCWQAGFDYGDSERWQYAWTVLSSELGSVAARPILGHIEDFVRVIREVGQGRIGYFPPPCCRTCASEQVILELIADLQAGEVEVVHRIAALCGEINQETVTRVLRATRALASALLAAGIAILPHRVPPAARPPFDRLH